MTPDDSIKHAPTGPSRVASVDALRGLTILLMVFVNDLGPAAPAWMHHLHPSDGDGMTLADVVFPWFLFIVGVSIPLAFERAEALGNSFGKRLGHVLARTAGLLLMGLMMMNHEEDRSPNALRWGTLAFAAILLAWTVVPRAGARGRGVWIVLKWVGIVGLAALLAVYRGEPGPVEFPIWGRAEGYKWLRIGWWGILGLIGWAYLTASLVTLFVGRRREWLMGALGLLMTLHLAMNGAGLFARVEKKPWLGPAKPVVEAVHRGFDGLGNFVGLGDATGSLAAIAVAGCLLGSILRRDSDISDHRGRLAWAMTFALGLALAGLATDGFEGINKNAATPAWCFFSASLACLLWMLLYLVMDVAGYRAILAPIRPAGANPLVAYFLHPIVVGSITLAGLGGTLLAYKSSADPGIVVGGSLAMACLVCAGTGLLGRLGLRARL